MSTFSSANITDGNLMLKERTHRIKKKYSMHQNSIRLHNLGNWLISIVPPFLSTTLWMAAYPENRLLFVQRSFKGGR